MDDLTEWREIACGEIKAVIKSNVFHNSHTLAMQGILFEKGEDEPDIKPRLKAFNVRISKEINIFTDGACLGNGTKGAVASFACTIDGSQYRNAVLCGMISPYLYVFEDDQLAVNDEVPAPHTNNRGEWLGIIYALLIVYYSKFEYQPTINVHTDSKLCVDTLMSWLPARLAKGTEEELKNYDLIKIAWYLLNKIRERKIIVAFIHVRGHQKDDSYQTRGNNLVDSYAARATKHADDNLYHLRMPRYMVLKLLALDLP